MGIVTQDAYRRQRLVKYANRYGQTAAAERYGYSRKAVRKWVSRYDGKLSSLVDRSRRPHSHPKQHTSEEILQIQAVYRREGSIEPLLLFQELREQGYTRSYGGMKRFLRKQFGQVKKKRRPMKPKPYQRAEYPGQKMQLDVKYVPSSCSISGVRYYQFTAVDECTRWTFRGMYDEHGSFSAKEFLLKLLNAAPFPIRLIQTDNGPEWTNALLVTKAQHKSLFEEALAEMGIEHQRIRIATPRHNGKVERQHRIDNERFYKKQKFGSLLQAKHKIAEYNIKSNNTIKTCLGLKSPNEILRNYLALM